MNSSKHQSILAQNFMASARKLNMKRTFTFHHDNDPKHLSQSPRADQCLEKLSQSPDLNLICQDLSRFAKLIDCYTKVYGGNIITGRLSVVITSRMCVCFCVSLKCQLGFQCHCIGCRFYNKCGNRVLFFTSQNLLF